MNLPKKKEKFGGGWDDSGGFETQLWARHSIPPNPPASTSTAYPRNIAPQAQAGETCSPPARGSTLPTSSPPLIPASPSPRHATPCPRGTNATMHAAVTRGEAPQESKRGREDEDERKGRRSTIDAAQALRARRENEQEHQGTRNFRRSPRPARRSGPPSARAPLVSSSSPRSVSAHTSPRISWAPRPRVSQPPSPTACACACTGARRAHTPNRNDAKRTDGAGGKERKEQETGERRKWGRRGMTTSRRKGEEKPNTADEHRRLSIKTPVDGTRGYAVMQAHRHRQDSYSTGEATTLRIDGAQPPTPGPRTPSRRRGSSLRDTAHATRASATRRYMATTQLHRPRHSTRRGNSAREHGPTAAALSAHRRRISALVDAQLRFAILTIADEEEGNAGSQARMRGEKRAGAGKMGRRS
ncbi:hypothetical protein DFH09DRAFT_1283045 [Mycena vulgaris]|nr:hypothetical protein DFH09DRAFT_1283045 [Mycena vulgaris]